MNTFVELGMKIAICYMLNNIYSQQIYRMLERTVIYFFEQAGKAITAINYDHFTGSQLCYNDFSNIYEKLWSMPYNYIVIDKSKNRYDCGKPRINWDWRVL